MDSSIDICSFSAPFLPRFDFGVVAASDLRFVPAASLGEDLVWEDDGLELCPASLADDLVPAIMGEFQRVWGEPQARGFSG